MKNLFALGLMALFLVPCILSAQDKEESKKDTVKTGFNLSGVPAVAYDSDIGFLYGIILNLYHYGDGTRYPRYNHSIYMEWSNTTKGSMKSILRYDSDQLIRGVRTSAEISYKTEQALDFYGFNGYKVLYDRNFTDDTHGEYLSRMYYKMDRKILLLRADFTGDVIGNKLKWFAGFEFQNMAMDTVNTTKLNEGKSAEKSLPVDVEGGLFGNYANNWGIIPSDQINGGSQTLLKAGLIYDTRDNEPNPMKGIWSEAQLLWAPSFLGNTSLSYGKLVLTHRQYFTLIPEDLNLVYRVSYQAKLGGEMPYYMLPWVYNSPPNFTRDGLGGNKTLRGILRNRVVGEDYFYANIEMRWKFLYFKLLNQNFYLALSGFMDAGKVTGEYQVDISGVPVEYRHFFPDERETLHPSAGGGLHIAWNRNFIVAVDYGRALNKRDGLSGLYIGLDFLF